ncbi:MAG: VTT domain-containing protein [Candidatus Sungbacteria bacterium]|uniref:VTT domain-containing protein n=1 Tax=Candidatus Sungiibacteriota bacterium TaxID=2750080 RepID=A0A932YW37_9BACT|nr:VTT domain-containing protein [Candidatus Sungbacteria bacterium]
MEFLIGFDLISLIKAVGYLGLFAIVFAESGLLLGFFLPGDSLLFTAGFLASQGYLDIRLLIAGCFIAAVAGDNIGYAFGYRWGRKIFQRPQSLLFNPKNLERAERFYELYGGSAIVLARFLPAIRTFAPVLAGVGLMRYSAFVFYNILGALLWAVGMPLLGYFFGSVIPNPDRYLIPVIIAIVTLSSLPALIQALRDRERRAWVIAFLRKRFYDDPATRKVIGVALVVFGFIALLIPFFPFAWVGFVGLEMLGLRTLFQDKIRSWRQRRRSHI